MSRMELAGAIWRPVMVRPSSYRVGSVEIPVGKGARIDVEEEEEDDDDDDESEEEDENDEVDWPPASLLNGDEVNCAELDDDDEYL